jgi:hypothetical protein
MNNEIETLKLELAAFKKNNEELIHRCNAAISSWDEERERALREADRANEWKGKYIDLERYMRFIGKQIPCNTGGTFENDPIDAILDATIRALTNGRKELEYNIEAADRALESLRYQAEKAKVFQCLTEMFYFSHFDNIDAIKKIYEITRNNYPRE